MKYWLSLLLVVATTATPLAAPPREEASKDAKWLLHVDFAELRSTTVGGYLLTSLQSVLGEPMAQLGTQLKLGVDPKKILAQVNSITVYGTEYQEIDRHAVVVLHTQPELEQIVVGTLAGMALAGTNASPRVQERRQGEITFYDVGSGRTIAVMPGRALVVGKSRELTDQAVRVLTKKSPNLASTRTFSEFADVKRSFFFLAVGEGFSSNPHLPPQARLLQLADGGRLVLGEAENRVFLDLALKAKTAEIVTQMQQVVQGLIAFGSLGQPENKDLLHLLQSIKVSTDKNIVNVTLDYPADQLVGELIDAKVSVKVKESEPKQQH